MKLDSNNLSKYSLYYMLILCTMNRQRVITNEISDRLREIFLDFPGYGITLENWSYTPDCARVTFKAQPNTELSKFLNAYKTISSRRIKTDFPIIKEQIGDSPFWSRGYCLITERSVSDEMVEQYIQSQGGDNDDNRKEKCINKI